MKLAHLDKPFMPMKSYIGLANYFTLISKSLNS